MAFSVKHEEISPQTAHEYLSKSVGNRKLNTDYVLSLAVAMEQDKWDDSASEIVFDEAGALIDGHHRLHAIVAFDRPVRMLVKRGVSKAARGLIDTGRTRGIADLMTMFRPGSDYVTTRRAALTTCVSLLVGGRRPPAIRTLDHYDTWMRNFRDGIDATVKLIVDMGARPAFRVGPVLGAFAFAHKLNPSKVEKFITRTIDGVGLTRGEPAYTLRDLLLSGQPTNRAGVERLRLARKVLNVVYADLKNSPLSKVQDGEKGLIHFRTAYDGKAIERLTQLWTGREDAADSASAESSVVQ